MWTLVIVTANGTDHTIDRCDSRSCARTWASHYLESGNSKSKIVQATIVDPNGDVDSVMTI